MSRYSIVLALLLLSCGRGYSDGTRVGTVTKFSHKGLFIKSWEGEANLGGMRQTESGLVPNIWAFTVASDKLVAPIESAMNSGAPVRLGYVQWFASPVSMDSDYEIVSVGEK